MSVHFEFLVIAVLLKTNQDKNTPDHHFLDNWHHPESLSDIPQTSCACAPILAHMHKKFEVNRTKIKGGCQYHTKSLSAWQCQVYS